MEGLIHESELIWTVINFVLFLAILRLVFYRPLTALLDARREQIRTNLETSRREREEAERLAQELRSQLAAAQQKAQEIIDQARQLAEREREARLAAAQQEAEQLLQRARATIERERDQAIRSLRAELADLTVRATERVLRRVLDEPEQRRLVEQAVDEVAGVR